MEPRLPTANEMQKLIDFLPTFSDPEFTAIKSWKTENSDGSLCLPHPIYTESVEKLFAQIQQECWIDYLYEPDKAKIAIENPQKINNASLAEIKTMLTYCWRGERFCDGFFANMIENGKIVALLERLRDILVEQSEQSS